jgi:hypothetical protein
LYELLKSTDEEEDKPSRIYRVMTNHNHIRKVFGDESMTDKECNELIQVAFKAKKSGAKSRYLPDSNDDKENSME